MKNKPLVSLIVPVYKAENYLYRCVESIRKQTYTQLELILVDYGSPDRCPEICDNFAKLDSRIKVIHTDYGGISSARNAGLDVIAGKYVAFIHCEDFIYKAYLQTLVFLCLKYNAEMAACGICYGKGSSFHRVPIKRKIYVYKKIDAFKSRKIKSGITGKLYKASLFNQERFPVYETVSENKKLNYSEESLTYKLIYKANQIAVTDKKMYYNYLSPLKINSKPKEFNSAAFTNVSNERIKYFEKCEIGLLDLSWEYNCIYLMQIYSIYKKDKHKANKKEILVLYKKAYKKVMQNQITPFSYKMMFTAFYLAPDKCSLAIKNY